jgi:hypothetical protein
MPRIARSMAPTASPEAECRRSGWRVSRATLGLVVPLRSRLVVYRQGVVFFGDEQAEDPIVVEAEPEQRLRAAVKLDGERVGGNDHAADEGGGVHRPSRTPAGRRDHPPVGPSVGVRALSLSGS